MSRNETEIDWVETDSVPPPKGSWEAMAAAGVMVVAILAFGSFCYGVGWILMRCFR